MKTPEEQGRDAANLPDDEAAETVPKPVDDPNLPVDGDPDDFDEEPVPDEDYERYPDNDETMDNFEAEEEPNDLSEVDKEFDD